MTYRFSRTLPVFLVISLFTPAAHAYIDPGTGSLIIQGIIGAIAAVGVTAKIYWHKLKVYFGAKKTSREDANREDVDS